MDRGGEDAHLLADFPEQPAGSVADQPFAKDGVESQRFGVFAHLGILTDGDPAVEHVNAAVQAGQ